MMKFANVLLLLLTLIMFVSGEVTFGILGLTIFAIKSLLTEVEDLANDV